MTLTDTTAFDANLTASFSTLATASANTAFRGLAWAPESTSPAPAVSSIVRLSPAGQALAVGTTSVTYRVTFSKAVFGLDKDDFALTATGTMAGTIGTVTAVSSSSNTQYDVVVSGITGAGDLRLDFKDNDTVTESRLVPVGGFGAQDFTSGQVYTLTAPAGTPSVTSVTTKEDMQTASGLVITANAAAGDGTTHYQITGITNGTLFQNNGTAIANNSFITKAEGALGLKFLPAPNFSGTGSFMVQASSSASTAGLGGSAVAATITVTALNDAPSGADTTVTVNEDTDYVFAAADFGFTDPNDVPANTLLAVKITALPARGTLTNNGVAVSPGDFVPFANITGGLLKFRGALNGNGAPYTTFTFQVQDNGGTGAGEFNLDPTPNTITVNVTAVNDGPVNTLAALTTDEDTAKAVTGFSIADVDSTGPFAANLRLATAGAGILTLKTDVPGGLTAANVTNNGTANLTISGATLAAINATLSDPVGLTYTPALNFNGSVIFAVDTTSDGNGGSDTGDTVTWTVNAVNDAPTFTASNPPASAEDDGAQTVPGFATFSPGPGNESGQSAASYAVTVVSTTGNLSFLAGPAVSAAGVLTYTANPNTNGTALISVTVTDDGGTARNGADTSAPQTFTILVTAVNDEPSFTAANPPAVNEGAGLQTVPGFVTSFTRGGGSDELPQIPTYLVTNVSNPGLFAMMPAVAADGTLTYALTTDAFGTFTFDVQVRDSGGTANPGDDDTSAVQTFTITVNPVNDAPTFALAGNPPAVNEDAGAQTVPGFAGSFSPGPANESAQTLVKYTVTAVSTTGNLAFTSGPAIANDGTLTYTLAPDTNGTATFEVRAMDDGGTAFGGADTSAPLTLTITVNAVNDAPSVVLAGNVTVFAPPFTVSPGGGTADGAYQQFNFASFSPGGGADEAGQVPAAYTVTTDRPDMFIGILIDTAGTLLFTLISGPAGTATVTVVPTDGGGTAFGGNNTGAPQTFTITVTPAPVPPKPVEPTPVPPAPEAPVGPAVGAPLIAMGTDAGTPATVRVLDARTGTAVREFLAFSGFSGGVRVALGDVTGDGLADVIAVTATGAAHVKVFDGATGAEVRSFLAFPGFGGGLTVAAGDVDGDGRADIVVGTASGAAHVKVFSGATGAELQSFLAFAGFAGGVQVAAGDVNGDGRADIAVLAEAGGGGHVRVLDGATGAEVVSFLGYAGYAGEIGLAVGDADGDGFDEVVTTARNAQGQTHVRAFDRAGRAVRSFLAPDTASAPRAGARRDQVPVQMGPARVGAGDATGDRVADYLLGAPPGPGAGSLVLLDGATGAVLATRTAFESLFGVGVYVDLD